MSSHTYFFHIYWNHVCTSFLSRLSYLRTEITYQLAQATLSKYHSLGGLYNRYLLLIVLDALKYRTKVPSDSVSSESFLPGLWMAAFSLCSQEKERVSSVFSLLKRDTNPIMRAPPSGPHLTLITSQRSILKYHHIGG